jgi:hypothetical protein
MEQIHRFCEGILPDFEQVALEDHLAACDECMGVMSRMDGLLYSGFTAETHAAALEAEERAADPLVSAIRQAASVYRDFAAVFRDWLGDATALWGNLQVRQLGEAGLVPVSGSATAQPVRIRLLREESRALIDVRESGQTLEIRSDAPPGAVALLFRSGEEASVRAAAFEPAGEMRVARFEQLAAGSYRLAIGPRRN